MTDRQNLETKLEAVEGTIKFLRKQLAEFQFQRTNLIYQLNRARRLEKELQDAKQQS